MEILEQHLPSGRKDGSVYTGTAGIALLYLMMHERNNNPAHLQVSFSTKPSMHYFANFNHSLCSIFETNNFLILIMN